MKRKPKIGSYPPTWTMRKMSQAKSRRWKPRASGCMIHAMIEPVVEVAPMEPWIAWTLLGLSIVGNILYSLVKLRWGKEFASAKDQTIRAKEAEIDVLKSQVKAVESLTPPKLREIHDATVAMYERNIKQLEESRDKANAEVKELETTRAESQGVEDIMKLYDTIVSHAAQQRELTERRLEDEKQRAATWVEQWWSWTNRK